MENNNSNSKTVWIVAGVIALALIVWFMMKKDTPDIIQEEKVGESRDFNEGIEATEDTTPGSVNVSSPAATISYANALIKYKDARLQINDQCQVSMPNSLTFKNNTNIMIDNRSKTAHVVKVGTPIVVKSYGFKIVNLSSGTLPATLLVDCDKSQNVATILIQK